MIFEGTELQDKIRNCRTDKDVRDLVKEIREETRFWQTSMKEEGIREGKRLIKNKIKDLFDLSMF